MLIPIRIVYPLLRFITSGLCLASILPHLPSDAWVSVVFGIQVPRGQAMVCAIHASSARDTPRRKRAYTQGTCRGTSNYMLNVIRNQRFRSRRRRHGPEGRNREAVLNKAH